MNIAAKRSGVLDVTIGTTVHHLTEQDCRTLIRLLERHVGDMNDVERIKCEVARAYRITVRELESHDRHERLCLPRFVAWQLAREQGVTYEEIGKAFGNRNNSSIVYGINALKDRLETREPLKREIDLIRKRLNQVEPSGNGTPMRVA